MSLIRSENVDFLECSSASSGDPTYSRKYDERSEGCVRRQLGLSWAPIHILGTVGIAGTLAILLIAGHVALGAGAILGIGAILAATNRTVSTDLSFVSLMERMFGLWGYVTPWLLRRGHIQPSLQATA